MNQWDQWVQGNALDGGLLQSEGWAQFQRGLGKRVDKIVIPASEPESRQNKSEILKLVQDDDAIGRTLVIEHRLPLAQTYIYSPRGPVCSSYLRDFVSSYLVPEVRKKFLKAIFWRIEPTDPGFRVQGIGYRVVKSVQPATTLIVDLSKSEEELLAQMKQKTRYNIKVAQKHGVVVIPNILISQYLPATLRVARRAGPNIQEQFLNLMDETAKRDGFRVHPREYYQKLLDIRNDTLYPKPYTLNPSFELFGAFQGDQLLAGAIVAFFGQWAYYLHGASSNEHRELMAPYLLHWEIMREAKRRGCTKYDLWGAGDEWPGVSKFKTGFAPATALTHYPGTFDVVLNPWKYWVYRFVQKLR